MLTSFSVRSQDVSLLKKRTNQSSYKGIHPHKKHLRNTMKQITSLLKIMIYFSLISDLFLLSVCAQSEQVIRPFPPLFNAALNRPIITEPSQSTCGVGQRSSYCKSSIFPISTEFCTQDFCVQTCPGRTEIPTYESLLPITDGFSNCVVSDTINTRPGSPVNSNSTAFIGTGPTCFLTPTVSPSFSSAQEFTITVWIWQQRDNEGTLIQKRSKTNGEIIFELNIRQSRLNFVYNSTIGLLTVTFPDEIPVETWTYIAIQVYGTSLSFYENGVGPGYSAAYTVSLVSQVQEAGESWVRVGLTLSGTYHFLGRLQDFRFYPVTLSNREIAEDYSGSFPELRAHTACRCPASHPRIKPLAIHYCIRNGVSDNTNDVVLRLNTEAHPIEYMNDGDANTIWISKNLDQVNLVVDLGDEFQVFYVVVQFYSPLPKAVEIQRQHNDGPAQWETWQQFAASCPNNFSTVDNGPLPTPTSVNCIKQSNTAYSKGNITFNILSPEPVPRPGYNDFYNTPELFAFVRATKVRVRMREHYYITEERHKYYGLYEYSIVGRCDCHGHAATCDHSRLPYQCDCLLESHTQGRMCNECQPLYSDKAFRRGDQLQAYSCRPCECYGHALSCSYDPDMDPIPHDHFSGGGGVCDNCLHNTEGRFCQMCITGYYRPTGKSMYDVDVCSFCDCYPLGVLDLQMDCEKEGGQCLCKGNVEGRQCRDCKPGFYNLTAQRVDGCQACDCHLSGTAQGDNTCSTDMGDCNCKLYVRGTKCDLCQYGYFNLTDTHPAGCESCNCNPFGSTNKYCDPDNGNCICKPNVVGRKCDSCAVGYWAFEEGCIPCNCNLDGTEPPARCNFDTGQCECKANVEGLKCDTCKDEAYGFGLHTTLGCHHCVCTPAGTIDGSRLCNKLSGDCVCKENVEGTSCNQCRGNTWGLSLDNQLGCVPCECDATGTQLGESLSTEDLSCHQNTGQCSCLANRLGRQCDDCDIGFFVSTELGGGCLVCDCHSKGSLPLTECDSLSGQCQCRTEVSGVTGMSCNECVEGHYGFKQQTGECSACDCAVSGSVNDTCDPIDGQCFCKEFTWKRRCDRCVKGSSTMEATNPYGCSKAPDQQPQPYHEPLSPTSLRIAWKQPDYPNGVINQYRVFRNDSLVFTVAGNVFTVIDVDLLAHTNYSYVVEATNSFGSVQSRPIVFQTPAGSPIGVVVLTVTEIRAKSARLTWNPPQLMNGPLLKYVLHSTTQRDPTRVDQWSGRVHDVTLTSLIPFTNYIFYVDSCTTGGCLLSEPVYFVMMSAVPEGMRPPIVMAVNNTALYIDWQPPEFPNGIVIFYELWMRGALEPDGTRHPTQTRVFHPGGQYNTRPTQMPQENALPPPDTNFTLSGLIPFTVYEFQVLAENNAGKAASPWVSGRTGATTPLFTPEPILLSISAYSLNVTWNPPTDGQSRGIIISYKVFYYMKTNLTENPFGPPYSWTLMYNATGDEFHYILHGLSPYSAHTLKIQACNSVGCVNSSDVTGLTQQAVPEGLVRPDVDGLNSSAMNVFWVEPAFLNGPAPYYSVQKTIPALSYPPQVIRGTRFPGGGYYLFPPDTIPPNVEFTGIRFWFRTRKRDGLLLFAASEGRQSEFVALQFKAGRPWFLFDPQGCLTPVQIQQDPNDDRYVTFNDDELHYMRVERHGNTGYIFIDHYKGCASFVTPFNDEGLPYNDNTWHQMIAWRDEKIAYISIDGVWEGARESTCAKGTIIGPNTGVYVGGLPADFEIRRSSNDPRAQLVHHSFQGCIRDIQVMQQKFPTEVWKTLDWNDALANELAFLNWEGCPINLDKGVHFMGQGFARFPPGIFIVGDRKLIEFGFRTNMHTGILFFAYGGRGIYIYCAVINSALHFEFANGISPGSVTFNRPGTNFCDSRWYDVILEKDGQEAKITIDGIGTEVSGNKDIPLTVLTVSELYVGGIPLDSEARNFVTENKLSMPVSAFGGCIRELVFDTFYSVDFLADSIEVANLNMDGCTPYHLFDEQCREDLLTEVYNGTDLQVIDSGLQPYTDYLYHVLATNDAGSGTSSWGYGRTKEGAPIGVTPPYEARMLSGFLVEFKWKAPISTAGLLTQLVLRGYNLDNTTIDPVEALFLNTSKRIGNITSMIPHTQYSIKMLACTSGGCAESEDGLLINTMEEAPQLVQPPQSVPGPTYIYVYWNPPVSPNGIITGYFLYMDGDLIYTGGQRWFNVTEDLQIFTSYVFHLKACTQVGCTEGPSSTLSTAQLPPLFMEIPLLKALGTTMVEARWRTPELIRGILERYLLYVSTVEGDLGEVIYNNTDFFLDYIIPDLIAGTTYYVSVSACTGGGCTTSEAANVTTEESAPEGVTSPVVMSPSPSQLHITWTQPTLPNGEIVRYDLYHNEVPVYTGMVGMSYNVGDLLPFSLHAFRITACTVQGCSTSPLVKARTQESMPQGFVAMDTRLEDPRTLSVKWNMPTQPNGMMYFDVFFEGIFYKDPDMWDYTTVFERRSLHRSQTYDEWVTITPVIPRSTYTVQVNASNTVGYILSNTVDADMPPGSPDGVRAPTLLSQTPTTITATWVPVSRKNTADDPLFILQFRYTMPGALVEDIFGPTSSFTYTMENLIAYTEYEFRLVAENSVGATRSAWVTATTRQDSGVDPDGSDCVFRRHYQWHITTDSSLAMHSVLSHASNWGNE